MKLSIIIVNYNVEYFLEQCLLSVEKAILGLNCEVWVVDNNSVDGSVAMVRSRFPWVKLIANTENFGFSKANNQAIRLSTAEYTLLLNPDTVVEEDTFTKVVNFMDSHPEAGGLGVKMLDGKGTFLPESKRGLPTPAVAFYKIFGLSALFPKSKKFGRYHLGFLDKNQTHEVEILSGAFMLLRKSALDKVGLLDEDYFMYGEDIDLSYRLILGGYKNYYFPETRIIHYKGESTKKSSINYVFVFYRAMVIFAKKHFSEKNVKTFSVLINLAIYLRASIAILNRFVQRAIIPFIDFLAAIGGMALLKLWYERYSHIDLAENILVIALPLYSFIWVISIYFSGGYQRPLRFFNLAKGLLAGSIIILMLYAILPETLRFSRALTLFGFASTAAIIFGLRGIYFLLRSPKNMFQYAEKKRFVIVGQPDECERVGNLLGQTNVDIGFVGMVSPEVKDKTEEHLGHAAQLHEIVNVHKINEVIFCARDLSSQDIISNMAQLGSDEIDFKIAPPESLYIIGSNSIEGSGELFIVDINSISKPQNRRDKRLFDIAVSLILLLLSPLLIWFVKQKAGFLKNIFSVALGKKSWVGFYKGSEQKLPKLKTGVLHPGILLKQNEQREETFRKLNVIYAKDYHLSSDLKLVLSCIPLLGK
jgi:GT2 family glycosyltransferase